ncbi:MAG: nitrous oxide reductase accessory protein NosL [Campylobacterota bacterium]|nr:nitrous oxide reductase accessory protein NosL [Campylobacterota bacterium]
MSVKKIFLQIGLSLLLSLSAQAAGFVKKASAEPILIQEGKEKHWCPVCGMNIKMFYKTSHTSKLHNGTKRQYCSIRCLAVDMEEYGIDLSAVTVVDAKTQKLINAKDAFYVVGSKVMGTMTKVSKLAFALEADALEFIQKYKGKIVNFDAALKMAQESLKSDIAMVKKKKKKKIYPMGKKIFEKVCKEDIDPTDYIEINELKSAIKNEKLCRPLKEKQLQAVALYLWEVKRLGDLGEVEGKVEVREDEKCPVCGMFTYKYPKWAAQIFYKSGNNEKHWSFDGVKDLMKFYFDAQKWGNYPIAKRENITKILVTDYYSQKGIDGTKAFYVIRSDVYGPMGHELIPFESEEDAKTFKSDHRGKLIITFDQIIEVEVYKLDSDE